jgi:hypothetical protein
MRALKARAPNHVNSREAYQKGCISRLATAQTDIEQQLPPAETSNVEQVRELAAQFAVGSEVINGVGGGDKAQHK